MTEILIVSAFPRQTGSANRPLRAVRGDLVSGNPRIGRGSELASSAGGGRPEPHSYRLTAPRTVRQFELWEQLSWPVPMPSQHVARRRSRAPTFDPRARNGAESHGCC